MQSKRIEIDGCETDYIAYDTGQILYERTREFVEPKYSNSEPPKVTLWFRREPHEFMLKDIIADCFIPNPYGLPCVVYIIDDWSDNSIYNLKRAGLINRARVNHEPQQIHEACRLIAEGNLPIHKIAEITGVNRHVLKRIRFYNGWSYIAKQYGIVCERQSDEDWSPEILEKVKNIYRNNSELHSRDVAKMLGVPCTRRFCQRARYTKCIVNKKRDKMEEGG